MPKQESKLELEQRAERIQTTIALLREQLSEIEAAGVVAPPGCYVARYQAKGANIIIGIINSKLKPPFSQKLITRMNILGFNT